MNDPIPKSSIRSIISLEKFPESIFFSSVQILSPDISKTLNIDDNKNVLKETTSLQLHT